MKFILKMLATALILIFTAAGLFAQDEINPDLKKRAQVRLERLAEKLDLTEDQQSGFVAIHKKFRDRAKAIKEQTDSREELMDLMYENRKAKIGEIKELLSPEQFAIFDKVDENRKKRKGKRGMQNNRGKRLERY